MTIFQVHANHLSQINAAKKIRKIVNQHIKKRTKNANKIQKLVKWYLQTKKDANKWVDDFVIKNKHANNLMRGTSLYEQMLFIVAQDKLPNKKWNKQVFDIVIEKGANVNCEMSLLAEDMFGG